jgi:nicotinate-nucleotide pyrophosphorylase (carboxylating)
MPVVRRVFAEIDEAVQVSEKCGEGEEFKEGKILGRLHGPTISLLKGERTALNFLQRLSGIASATQCFVEAVKGTRAKILDTRKTTPGLRSLEKYAVKAGGGTNHRFSLSDMVLIKDNHLRHIGSIGEAVRRARAKTKSGIKIEVEVTDSNGAREAVESGADIIMLDNMSLEEMKESMGIIAGRVPVEVSGKMSLDRVRDTAEIGVDFISVGALTHSAKSLDISLDFLN